VELVLCLRNHKDTDIGALQEWKASKDLAIVEDLLIQLTVAPTRAALMKVKEELETKLFLNRSKVECLYQ
jgi:hypothetical protein